METVIPYDAGTDPLSRPASPESHLSLMLVRRRLGFSVYGAEKATQRQVNLELACLTNVLHSMPQRTGRRP